MNITRRQFSFLAINNLIATTVTGTAILKGQSVFAQDRPNSNQKTDSTDLSMEDWISQWQTESAKNKELNGPLDLRRFLDPMYILLNEIGWKANENTSPLPPVRVPKGFVTDFASIPRVFWSIFKPDGNYAYAAVLHDYLYWQQGTSKPTADAIFRAAMKDSKITDFQSSLLYRAVDMFGETAWNDNKKLKLAGERRILSKFPDRFNVTWNEWKSKSNVFSYK